MNGKGKAAIIAAAVLLLAGTFAFAQAGNSSKAEGQQAPFDFDQKAYCYGSRGGCGSGYGDPGDYNESPDDGGNGSGFDCH